MQVDRRSPASPPAGARQPALRLVARDGVRCDEAAPTTKREADAMGPAGSGEEGRRRRRSLVALGLVAGLVVVCLWLTDALRRQGRIEDCLMAHRVDCDRFAR